MKGVVEMSTMELFVIEKRIPIPVTFTATVHKMEVGDSFLIPGCTTKRGNNLRSMLRRLLPNRYTILKVDGGYRVWRTK